MMKSILASLALTAALGVTLFPLSAAAAGLQDGGDRFTSDLQNSCGDHGDHSDHKPQPRRGSR